MKKLLGIAVLGLLLSGNAFASKMVFNCEYDDAQPGKKNYSRINYIVDPDKKFFEMNFVLKCKEYFK